MSSKTLILGGARSGKSKIAQKLAGEHINTEFENVSMIVTADIYDEEMLVRIDKHRATRPQHWQVIESDKSLATAICNTKSENIKLIDCLTLWLTKFYIQEKPDEKGIEFYWQEFINQLSETNSPVIIVSNELGQGIVPISASARDFRDRLGFFHQELAQLCNSVYFVIAGIPQKIK